jgi:CDP-diacylglycerol--glycerol-3-phosphate 3-phosphatidyltransferase
VSGSLVSPGLRARVRGLMEPIALGFGRLGLTPNALTVIGFLIACVAAVAAASQAWLAAGLLVVFGGVFDLFDGALARATGKVTKLGAFMDSTFDRAGEAVVYVGIIAGTGHAFWPLGGDTIGNLSLLASAAMAASFLVSYTRAKAESLGFTTGTGMANVGLAPREIRIAILTVGLVLTGIGGGVCTTGDCQFFTTGTPLGPRHDGADFLAGALALITILATITTIQRILHTINQAANQEKG